MSSLAKLCARRFAETRLADADRPFDHDEARPVQPDDFLSVVLSPDLPRDSRAARLPTWTWARLLLVFFRPAKSAGDVGHLAGPRRPRRPRRLRSPPAALRPRLLLLGGRVAAGSRPPIGQLAIDLAAACAEHQEVIGCAEALVSSNRAERIPAAAENAIASRAAPSSAS